MVSICKVLINVVRSDKREDANTLEPKGKWSGTDAPNSSVADGAPPAKRHNLTHSTTHTKRGKPVVLLNWFYTVEESEPQGEPKGLRVWEDETSKCHLVMRWIGIEPATAISSRAKAS